MEGFGETLDGIFGAVGRYGDTIATVRDRFRSPDSDPAVTAVPIDSASTRETSNHVDGDGSFLSQLRANAGLVIVLTLIAIGAGVAIKKLA